jgi:hypothetical protein
VIPRIAICPDSAWLRANQDHANSEHGYLPAGCNDIKHAEQRMAMGIEERAISNVPTKCEPIWGPWAAKLRIPKLLPEWWVRQSKP